MLLVRADGDRWGLPGGEIDHGEHPADAVVREVAEETGLAVTVEGVRDAAAELVERPPYLEHTDGIVFDLTVTGGRPRQEARWVSPAEAVGLPLSRFAADALGQPAGSALSVPAEPPPPPGRQPRPPRGQRFAVYGLVADPAGRVLLTLIAEGYPGAGLWHLPGGGTDFGEQPRAALLREVTEESGQVGLITGLLAATHHHNRAALGPEGYPIDWHAVRVIFRVEVPEPTSPQVLDRHGSTAQAGWFTRTEAIALPLTEVATTLLATT